VVDGLMEVPAWNHAVFFAIDLVLQEKTMLLQRLQDFAEVALVVGEAIKFKLARSPSKSALTINTGPQRRVREPQRQACITLGLEETFVLEKLGLDGANAGHGSSALHYSIAYVFQ
jgi:hypothetical protein